jgi:TRAP-type C4-dicarboxylate transport system substrate-binding protein
MEQRELWERFVADAMAKLKEKNVTFVDVDKQSFIEATAPVREEYGAPYADLVARIQALQ